MEAPMIGTLLDSFDQNKRFKLSAYYSINFGTLASGLRVLLPLEQSKKSVESVLNELDLEQNGFSVVYKNWDTEDFQNAKAENDYAHEYVFKSTDMRTLVYISARIDQVILDFLYDASDNRAEQWVLQTNNKLRSLFGKPKSPKFKVLIHQEGVFDTEDVNTNNFDAINVQELYNDDFIESNDAITKFMEKQESGIILLHGEPGTGKTTYIKHLISKFDTKDFIFVQNDFVGDLLKPSFISFLLRNKNAILIIEDAEKVIVSRDRTAEDSVVSTILQLTDGLFSDFLNLKVICTFNTDIARIDKALLRKGRMIAKYHFGPLAADKAEALAKKLGHEDLTGSRTLADIFRHDKREFKDSEKRPIGFNL